MPTMPFRSDRIYGRPELGLSRATPVVAGVATKGAAVEMVWETMTATAMAVTRTATTTTPM